MNKYIQRANLLNPVVIFLYGLACYYLAQLARYGGVRRRVPIIIITTILLLSWFIYVFYKMRKQKSEATPDKLHNNTIMISKWWFYTALVALSLITAATGFHIYESSIPYNGRLSWYLESWRSEREVPFEHENNIYTDGLNGLMAAIDEEVKLPENLYVNDEVTLTFNQDGEITDFYGFLYGRNAQNTTETFLISYEQDKSKNIKIHLDNYLEATYNEDKLFRPLVDGLTHAPFQDFLHDLNKEAFGLSYTGFEIKSDNFGLTRYYDESGFVDAVDAPRDTHVGYSFLINPGNKEVDLPIYFVAYDPAAIQAYQEQAALEAAQESDPNYFSEEEIAEEYFVDDDLGYQLVIVDAALGSRFYSLRQTVDRGENWLIHNADPFLGETGGAAGLKFIDKNLGFIALSHNGGTEADLFRTDDGGETFQKIKLEAIVVELYGSEFEPFDFPEMPTAENSTLILPVGQGADGDYLNNAKAIFISEDNGQTFEFVKIEE